MTHGISRAVAIFLLEASIFGTATEIRAGNLNNDSLNSFKNLAGRKGKIQERTIFDLKGDDGSSGSKNPAERSTSNVASG